MAENKGPKLPDLQTLIQAGIDPKTHLPKKVTDGLSCALKDNTKKFLRIIDEQDAVNRYVWYNIPANITSQELERMLYYRGQLCFFFDEELEEFYFMPYCLDGTIDFYGRYNSIHPIPLCAGQDGVDKKHLQAQQAYLAQKKLKCIYGLVMPEDLTLDTLTKSTVLLHDYTKQLPQSVIPRSQVNDPLLDAMAECVPYMTTGLLLSSGVKGVRVNDADQEMNVREASQSVKEAAISQNPWVPIIGNLEFQEFTNGAPAKSEEYMLAMQSLDNLRLSGYGIDNGGLFEKKAHELQSEADLNGGPVGLVLQDGLSIRQNFCNIVNSIWDVGIWCEPAENVSGIDRDGDGAVYDENSAGENSGTDNSQSTQTEEVGSDE